MLLAVIAVQLLGTGMVLPFHVVYLHEVRGFTLPLVGALLAIPPIGALVLLEPSGAAVDRFGPRALSIVNVVRFTASSAVFTVAATTLLAPGDRSD